MLNKLKLFVAKALSYMLMVVPIVISIFISQQLVHADQLYKLPTSTAFKSFPKVRPMRAQLTSRRYTTLSSELNGKIIQLTVSEGKRFKKNNLLIKVDCTIYQAQADKAKAILDEAKVKYKAANRLYQLKTGGQMDRDIAQIEIKKSRADVQMIQAQLKKCQIKAPYHGIVSQQFVQNLQYVQSGDPLLEIIDEQSLQIEFIAPSRYLRWLKPGYVFTLHIDETNQDYPAVVERFSGKVDGASQSIKVFAQVVNEPNKKQAKELMAGMSGLVKIKVPEQMLRQNR